VTDRQTAMLPNNLASVIVLMTDSAYISYSSVAVVWIQLLTQWQQASSAAMGLVLKWRTGLSWWKHI